MISEYKHYQQLGQKLRTYRIQKTRQSIKQVGRGLNLTHSYISKLENGFQRPSWETLNKLIRHYSLTPMETSEIYYLAGYILSIGKEVSTAMDKQPESTQGVKVNLPAIPVLYCDSAFVTANKFGIVFDFAQSMMGPNNQHNVVARIGMSAEHAKALLELLKDKLEHKVSNSKN